MGTPQFAVPMLETLVASEHKVVGVVTATDKPAGRGNKIQQSEVKQCALKHNLKVLQPPKLKAPEFLEDLRSLQADLFVVVAFRMLPQVVWGMPPLGTINLHASLLPQYRGAAPINWAVINGEKETGVTTFFIQQEIDTGAIIFKESIPIRDDETVGELYGELMDLGAAVLLKTVNAIAGGNYPQTPQDHITDVKQAPKIFKDTCRIDFNKPVAEVYNFIRGLSPYPAAHTNLDDKGFKIFKTVKHVQAHEQLPGTYRSDDKTYINIYCADGWLEIKECQLEGKKRMSIDEFLRGYKLQGK